MFIRYGLSEIIHGWISYLSVVPSQHRVMILLIMYLQYMDPNLSYNTVITPWIIYNDCLPKEYWISNKISIPDLTVLGILWHAFEIFVIECYQIIFKCFDAKMWSKIYESLNITLLALWLVLNIYLNSLAAKVIRMLHLLKCFM